MDLNPPANRRISPTKTDVKGKKKITQNDDCKNDTLEDASDLDLPKWLWDVCNGGCDGYVNVWDGDNKKRLYQYSKYPSSIAALSFNKDGHLLAVASSYTFEEGDIPHEPDAMFIRKINEIEVKPNPKALPAPPS